ncbi:MAG: hypothetical protein ACJAZS_000460 [Alteromonas naphthalenivorans]
MKNVRGVIQISILFFGCLGTRSAIKRMYAAPLPKKISLHIDSHFSKTLKERLNTFATEHQKLSFSAGLLNELIKETFPVVESVTLKNYFSGDAQVFLKGAYPIALVNDDFILTSNNALVRKDVYPVIKHKDLPLFYAAQTVKDKEQLYLSSACKKFIKTFDRSLLQEYEVQWVNGTLVQLRDRKHARFTLLINGKTDVTQKIKTAYARIKDKKMYQQTQSKRGRDWFVDARFRNQIIVFLRGEKV